VTRWLLRKKSTKAITEIRRVRLVGEGPSANGHVSTHVKMTRGKKGKKYGEHRTDLTVAKRNKELQQW